VKHYLNTAEDTYNGKIWTPAVRAAVLPGPLSKDVLAKAGVAPPHTWTQLLAACDALNAKGITPIAGGISDGWFGGCSTDDRRPGHHSVGDVLGAVAGKKKFTDPAQAAWWTRLQEMRDHKCWNKDINSVQLYQGQQKWSDGKAAMTVTPART